MKHLAQHRGGFRHLWWLVTLLVLLMAVYVVAGRQLMRMLPTWRVPLQTLLQQRTGLPIAVANLTGRMEGLTPVFRLDGVVIPAADGDPSHALAIHQVSISLDLLMSLLHRSVWLREVNLSGLNLDLAQDSDGHFQLRGFPRHAASPGQGNLHTFLQLLYQQKQVVLDKVNLSLQINGMPPIATRDARLEMTSSGSQHRLALWLSTREQPLTLDVRLHLDKDAYDLGDLDGTAYLALSGKNIQYWLPKTLAARLHLQQLTGKLAFWLTLDDGQLQRSSLSLQVDDVVFNDGQHQWQARDVRGLVGARNQDGYQVQVQGLDFNTSGGHWHNGTLGAWWNGQSGDAAQWKLLLTELDAQQLSEQLLHWPLALPDALLPVRARLEKMRPRALVDDLYVSGTGRQINHLSGRFANASFEADGKLPGLGGLSGWFDGTPDTGVAVVSGTQITLALPEFYDHAFKGAANGDLRWFHDGDGQLRLETGVWHLSNADGDAVAVAGVTLVPGQVPLLHLLADVKGDHIERAGVYLPSRKMPPTLTDWLQKALVGGRLTSGRFLYEGPVHIDPLRQQDRTFQMQFAVADAGLHFMPDWPSLQGIAGRVLVDGRKVYGRDLSGVIYNSHFSNANFDVWDDNPGEVPLLLVSAWVDGQAEDVSKLLHDSPLAKELPAELKDWQLSQGKVSGNLLLQLALKHAPDVPPRVIVQARMSQVKVANATRRLTFDGVAGDIHFGLRDGIQAPALNANWLGNPLTGSVATAKGKVTIRAAGQVNTAALSKWFRSDWLTQLVSGSAAGQATILLPWLSKQPVVLQVASDLKGVATSLPAPLAKTAATAAPLSLTFTDGKRLLFTYRGAPEIKGNLWLADGKLQNGTVHLGAGAAGRPHQTGLLIKGHLPRLKVQTWVDYITKMTAQGGGATWPVLHLKLRLGELDLYGFPVDKAVLQAAPAADGSWQMSVDSPALAGQLVLPADFQWRGDKPLELTIAHLVSAQSDTKSVASHGLSPLNMPVADVNLQQVTLGGVDYGSWQGQLRPQQNGVQVQNLKGQWRHAAFTGTLDWTQQKRVQSSHFKGGVTSTDLGALQKAWGITPLVVSDKASAQLDLTWPGSPLDIDYLGLTGKAEVSIGGTCRLPHMDSNNPLLRLLGVLNVSSIARRLRFDFSDLYKKGLSCDSITSNLAFDQEQLTINKLHMKSPSADVQLSGSADLDARTLDDDMTVMLPLSSNLYAGCLAGPAACAGIFVFDRLLGSRLEKAAALHYHVSGSWTNPVVKEK